MLPMLVVDVGRAVSSTVGESTTAVVSNLNPPSMDEPVVIVQAGKIIPMVKLAG